MKTDKRDTRDPLKLGEAILYARKVSDAARKKLRRKPLPLSQVYDADHVYLNAVEAYTGEGEGIQAEQQAKYEAEFPDGLPTNDDPGGQ